MLSVVRSRSCGQKPHSIWSLLAPSTYKYVHLSRIPGPNPSLRPPRATGHVRRHRTNPRRHSPPTARRHVAPPALPRRRPARPEPGPPARSAARIARARLRALPRLPRRPSARPPVAAAVRRSLPSSAALPRLCRLPLQRPASPSPASSPASRPGTSVHMLAQIQIQRG